MRMHACMRPSSTNSQHSTPSATPHTREKNSGSKAEIQHKPPTNPTIKSWRGNPKSKSKVNPLTSRSSSPSNTSAHSHPSSNNINFFFFSLSFTCFLFLSCFLITRAQGRWRRCDIYCEGNLYTAKNIHHVLLQKSPSQNPAELTKNRIQTLGYRYPVMGTGTQQKLGLQL